MSHTRDNKYRATCTRCPFLPHVRFPNYETNMYLCSLTPYFLLLLLTAFQAVASPLALVPMNSSSLISSTAPLNDSNVMFECTRGRPPRDFSEDCRHALISFVNRRMSLPPSPGGSMIYYDFGHTFPFLPPLVQPVYPRIRIPLKSDIGTCTLLIEEPGPGQHGLLTEPEFYSFVGSLWKTCIKDGLNVVGTSTETLKVSFVVRGTTTSGEEDVNGTTSVASAVAVE